MEKHNRGLGLGIFILTIGVIWVLVSVGVITWSIIDALTVLWPLILVIIGVNIIFRRNGIIRAIAWVAFLAVLISYSYFFEDKGTSDKGMQSSSNVTVQKTADIQKGELRLAFGGTKIQVDSNTSNVLDAAIQDSDILNSKEYKDGNKTVSIAFEKKHYRITNFSAGIHSFNNQFHLSSDILWDMDIDTGAADSNFDLSNLKVGKLTLNIGATNVKLALGDRYDGTSVKINAGASKIDMDVPKTAGVRVKMDGGLNSTNFDEPGWEKKDGYYYSPGYEQTACKIDVDVDMGVGKLSVNLK